MSSRIIFIFLHHLDNNIPIFDVSLKLYGTGNLTDPFILKEHLLVFLQYSTHFNCDQVHKWPVPYQTWTTNSIENIIHIISYIVWFCRLFSLLPTFDSKVGLSRSIRNKKNLQILKAFDILRWYRLAYQNQWNIDTSIIS